MKIKSIKKSFIVETIIGITLLLIAVIAIGAAISQCTPDCKSVGHSKIYYATKSEKK